jgi:hypothetical protein
MATASRPHSLPFVIDSFTHSSFHSNAPICPKMPHIFYASRRVSRRRAKTRLFTSTHAPTCPKVPRKCPKIPDSNRHSVPPPSSQPHTKRIHSNPIPPCGALAVLANSARPSPSHPSSLRRFTLVSALPHSFAPPSRLRAFAVSSPRPHDPRSPNPLPKTSQNFPLFATPSGKLPTLEPRATTPIPIC